MDDSKLTTETHRDKTFFHWAGDSPNEKGVLPPTLRSRALRRTVRRSGSEIRSRVGHCLHAS
jgi:hypothetical protein